MTRQRNVLLIQLMSLFLATPLLAAAPLSRDTTFIGMSADEPPRSLAEMAPRAARQVLASAGSNDPQTRTNAIEACEFLQIARATPQLQLALEDNLVPVRFAALVTIGRVEARSLVPSVKRVLKEDDLDPHVRAAALFALHRCGKNVDLSHLARMLRSDDAGMRGNAAMLLGMMRNRSAVPMLKELGRARLPATMSHVHGVIVRIQIAEARARLGDESAMSMIRSGLFSSYDEVRVLAAGMLGRIGDNKMEEAFFGILQDDREATIELKLAALDSLMRMERSLVVLNEAMESIYMAVDAANLDSPVIRAQAAQTLGTIEAARRRGRARLKASGQLPPPHVVKQFGRGEAAAALLGLLDDPVEAVRLAASASLLAAVRRAGTASEG